MNEISHLQLVESRMEEPIMRPLEQTCFYGVKCYTN